jgi:hypothetical protein
VKYISAVTERNVLDKKTEKELITQFNQKLTPFISKIINYIGASGDEKKLKNDLSNKFRCMLHINDLVKFFNLSKTKHITTAIDFIQSHLVDIQTLYVWLIIHQLGQLQDENYSAMISISWLDELLLGKLIYQSLQEEGFDNHDMLLIKSLTLHPHWLDKANTALSPAFDSLLQYQESNKYLQVNRYQDVLYLNREVLQELLAAFFVTAIIGMAPNSGNQAAKLSKNISNWYKVIRKVLDAADAAGYRIDKIQESLVSANYK